MIFKKKLAKNGAKKFAEAKKDTTFAVRKTSNIASEKQQVLLKY